MGACGGQKEKHEQLRSPPGEAVDEWCLSVRFEPESAWAGCAKAGKTIDFRVRSGDDIASVVDGLKHHTGAKVRAVRLAEADEELPPEMSVDRLDRFQTTLIPIPAVGVAPV